MLRKIYATFVQEEPRERTHYQRDGTFVGPRCARHYVDTFDSAYQYEQEAQHAQQASDPGSREGKTQNFGCRLSALHERTDELLKEYRIVGSRHWMQRSIRVLIRSHSAVQVIGTPRHLSRTGRRKWANSG